ncbi:MAG: hypothetical protein EOO39_17945 [Cytophagaceae bacterium]|nr:MAG: hypothetical protein EOO39_17945 [Cytophagaceae bacterium]
MRQSLLLFGLLTAGMLGLLLYYAALINCVHHYRTGLFASHSAKAGLEIGGLLTYSWLGLKFLKWRLVPQNDPTNKAERVDL